MADEAKDTIYVDIDDEITSVIDKVQASSKNLVALVLPKRAPVFGSIVNMKLLKRKSQEAKKNIVLVTTESSILPLAGAVGMHVAKTLASKPEIPDAPEKADHFVNASEDEAIDLGDEEATEEESPPADLKKMADEPVGKLSGLKEEETIELDNAALAAADAEETEKGKEPKAAKKDKNLKVPNFERFRLWTLLGIGLLLLIIVLFILAAKILPKATIDIKTNAQNVSANLNFNLSTTATSLDSSNNTLPAKQATETKTFTAEVNTTGHSVAQVATGSIAITAVSCPGKYFTSPQNIPAGTTVSQNNNNYTTQSTVTFPSQGTKDGSGCYDYAGNNPTEIIANNAGSAANTSGATFAVPSPSNVQGVNYSGSGSASGGADAAQVVAASDISSAESKISTNANAVKSVLSSQLTSQGYMPLDITFSPGTPNISPSTPVDGAATTVTVTETINYSIYGVKQHDLTNLIDSSINSQVPPNQSIISSGLSNASYSIGSSPTNINIVTKAEVGPNLNINQLKHKIIGYKSGQIQALIMQNANVKSVSVHFSPFFVSTVPSNLSHITINVSKPS